MLSINRAGGKTTELHADTMETAHDSRNSRITRQHDHKLSLFEQCIDNVTVTLVRTHVLCITLTLISYTNHNFLKILFYLILSMFFINKIYA